ncbi:unnamed protein product [Clonostachys solani]|uniref:Uncharacterized protein n=1 Tax=Clonostachys solani TaxID=160281 RepID=A0A9P0EJ17_9HYPO|nr:unnamed protein product [Clonostachys solani]
MDRVLGVTGLDINGQEGGTVGFTRGGGVDRMAAQLGRGGRLDAQLAVLAIAAPMGCLQARVVDKRPGSVPLEVRLKLLPLIPEAPCRIRAACADFALVLFVLGEEAVTVAALLGEKAVPALSTRGRPAGERLLNHGLSLELLVLADPSNVERRPLLDGEVKLGGGIGGEGHLGDLSVLSALKVPYDEVDGEAQESCSGNCDEYDETD